MFTITMAGLLPNDEDILNRITDNLRQIDSLLPSPSGSSQIRLAISPPYTGAAWQNLLNNTNHPVCLFTGSGESTWDGSFDQHIHVDSPLRDTLGEMLCDHSDLLLAVWDEDVKEMDGATWELMRIALRKHMPTLWISSRTGKAYWPTKTSFEPYRPEKLEELCSISSEIQTEADSCDKKDFPLLFIGRRLYKRYLRRYKASAKKIDAEEDLILKDDYHLTGKFASADKVRESLLSKFNSFDRTAIELNERYHSALYWRSVLPLITTLIVAVGFYSTSVLAGLFDLPLMTWGIIAGFGFLIHGFMNLYVFMLSKSKTVKANQEKMIRNRRIAEMLRVLIHFVPFGIHPDLRALCGDDRALYASLHQIVDDADPDPGAVTHENSVEAFRHLDQMLSDQIAYHKLSVDRYARLVKHLENWSRIIFYIGFWVVVLRAFLQFLMSIPGFSLPALQLANDVTPRAFISNLANMASLLLPTWYAYFSTKLSLCNFRFNRDNHQQMSEILEEERKNIAELRDSIDKVPIEALQAIGENLAQIMLVKDTSMWTQQYQRTRIDHL